MVWRDPVWESLVWGGWVSFVVNFRFLVLVSILYFDFVFSPLIISLVKHNPV